jgi:RNA polymerase sigma factor (sigma-70 family)
VSGASGNGGFDGEAVQAAAQILNEYGGFIRAVIHFQVRDRSDEEDLFQEFFLALICTPVPGGVQHIKSYLYRAVVNHIIDSVRVRQNYRRALKKYAKENRISVNSRVLPNAFLDEKEKEAMVAYYARHMQEREAQAFVLRYRDQYSNEEIAAKMGVTRRTVSRYLSEGLKRLRKTLTT